MPDDITAATADDLEVTATAEEPESTESTEQENTTAQLAEIQTALSELQTRLEVEAAARLAAEERATTAETKHDEAQREVVKKDRAYNGLMASTTAKMQELKLLQQALANQEITDSKLNRMERLVSELASNSLDPERVQQITRDIDNEQMRKDNERLRAQQAASQQPQERPVLTTDYKNQLKNAYFKEFTNVGIDELTDDEWYGSGASGPEDWKNAVYEVFARKSQAKQVRETPPVDAKAIAAEMRLAMQEELAAIRNADAQSKREAEERITALQEELAETRRLSEETLNRTKGRDRAGSPAPGAPEQKLQRQLADIPESWLYGTPEQRKAYRDALNNPKLRNQIINQARGS